MELSEKTAFKGLVFGLGMPLITLPLTRQLPAWAAWGIAGSVSCALFHWLPPRIHSLTPLRSAGLVILSGLTAAAAVALAGLL